MAWKRTTYRFYDTMKLKRLYKKFLSPLVQFHPRNVRRYLRYIRQTRQYKKLGGIIDSSWPILGEDTGTHAIDPHYFYQGYWAARHIVQQRPSEHVDVGSQINLLGYLSTITNVISVELRPIALSLPKLISRHGSITDIPFKDDSVHSLSSLHVIEHIGLGRYGDSLDPDGPRRACAELTRVLAPNGRLYLSVPIGRERTEFNAHRIFNPKTIRSYFKDLMLLEFSAVTDAGELITNADSEVFDKARYACGLFLFTKQV